MDCIFCRIVSGEIESDILFQDEEVVVFGDIKPAAPVHLLVVPRKHIEALAQTGEEDAPLLAHMVAVANRMARDKGLVENGYRLVINSGPHGGQVVPHLHLHLLGGRQLGGLG